MVRHMHLFGLAAVLIAMALTSPARAAVLFADNFETDALSINPSSPQAGSWADFYSGGGVTTNNGSPGATQGSQYLDQARGGSDKWSGAALTSPASSGHLVTTLSFQDSTDAGGYISSISFTDNTSNVFTYPPYPDSSAYSVLTFYHYNGDLLKWVSGTGAITTINGISLTSGVWHSLTIDIGFGLGTSGGDEFTLTVDATTVGPITFNGSTVPSSLQAPITRFYISTWNTDTTYVDALQITDGVAVPEPASLALLGLGGFLLLKRRKV